MAEREAKPTWLAVPEAVREGVEDLLGDRVVRATRAFGGYGPSATFVLTLSDSTKRFFKGVYPLPADSKVKWMQDEEERVYRDLEAFIVPWAPRYFGSLRREGWHVMLLEAIHGERVVPWTPSKARRAARSYAEFHAGTLGVQLPGWLASDGHLEFAHFWRGFAADAEGLDRLAQAADPQAGEARRWLDAALPSLIDAEQTFAAAPRPFTLLHSDTRSDNIRLQGDLLRLFDWPFAFVGPAEFDLAAFAQSIAAEGGPDPDETVAWYADVLRPRPEMVTASAAGIAGYFADRAPQPELPGLPRLRSVQRRQLKASLRWAARLLGLPDPAWLVAIPD